MDQAKAFYVPAWKSKYKMLRAHSVIVLLTKQVLPWVRDPARTTACWKSKTYTRMGMVLIENGKITSTGMNYGVTEMTEKDLNLPLEKYEKKLESLLQVTSIYFDSS